MERLPEQDGKQEVLPMITPLGCPLGVTETEVVVPESNVSVAVTDPMPP